MDSNRKKLEQRRLELNVQIENIKKHQNELTLKNIRLNALREKLERKKLALEKRLICNSNKNHAIRQILSFQINSELLDKLYLN